MTRADKAVGRLHFGRNATSGHAARSLVNKYNALSMMKNNTLRSSAFFEITKVFRFLRHQPISPPLAKIRPGSPPPITGPGTLLKVPVYGTDPSAGAMKASK